MKVINVKAVFKAKKNYHQQGNLIRMEGNTHL